MISRRIEERSPPKKWAEIQAAIRRRWLLPLVWVNWLGEWAAYWLSRWSIVEFLEYCGSLSLLVAVVVYFMDAPQRRKLRHYQAWAVIDAAQGKGGNGGRIEALDELNDDGVPLVGVNVAGAFLQGVRLAHADLHRGDFSAADLRDANFSGSNLFQCSFVEANLRRANLTATNLTEADLSESDLVGADLAGADLSDADLSKADLLDVMNWKQIKSLDKANIHDVQNAPDGFLTWAAAQGATDAPQPK